MTTKGFTHSAITKRKMALANKKDRTELHNSIKTYISTLKKDDFPSITSCAIHAGVSEFTLLNYESRTEDNSEVRQLLAIIRDLQKESLMYNGLKKNFDSRITTLLLKAHHGLKEEPNIASQTNILNVSPELLQDAITISRSKK